MSTTVCRTMAPMSRVTFTTPSVAVGAAPGELTEMSGERESNPAVPRLREGPHGRWRPGNGPHLLQDCQRLAKRAVPDLGVQDFALRFQNSSCLLRLTSHTAFPAK